MTTAVLFDLGNTLAQYFERSEFPIILEQAIAEVQNFLRREGLLSVSPEAMWHRVQEENHEAPDHRVRSLEGRLARIFQLDACQASGVAPAMCRCFMKPIFARGQCYEDTLPALQALRAKGLKTAIVSNTPWGSPGCLWRAEVERLGLREYVDAVVFCTDVGWRKPAKQIFEFALEKLHALPQDCLFVGDHPRWDVVGPRTVGMEAVLIQRTGAAHDTGPDAIRTLYELWDQL